MIKLIDSFFIPYCNKYSVRLAWTPFSTLDVIVDTPKIQSMINIVQKNLKGQYPSLSDFHYTLREPRLGDIRIVFVLDKKDYVLWKLQHE